MADTDEIATTGTTSTVGERLRAARESRGLSLEDIATQTRIPRRHLEAIEAADWERLPAMTYTIGFAKSYASAVGLDRSEVAEDVRAEMGGQRPMTAPEVFEAADPARTMPKWLVLGAIGAILVVVLLMSWLSQRSLESGQPAAEEPVRTAQPQAAPVPGTPQPAPAPQGPVMLAATEPVWIQVTDQGRTLFMGELAAGQTYTVPDTAGAPLLKAGKPEALRVTVGGSAAPPVGPPGRVVSNVSLRAADLMGGGATPAAQNTAG